MTENQITRSFINIGIVSTIIASILYALYYYLNLSPLLDLVFAMLFALTISLSSNGIYHFIRIHTNRPCLQVGLKLSILAGLVFALTAAVRISLQWPLEGILVQGDQSFTYCLSSRVFMGLEFVWKLLFALGIILLALPAFNHPKLGKILPILGILFGLMIVIVNFISFPERPESVNLTGMGPAAGLWHLLVSIFIILSPSWIKSNTQD